MTTEDLDRNVAWSRWQAPRELLHNLWGLMHKVWFIAI